MWSRGSFIALLPAGLKLQVSVQVRANINNINNLGLRRSRRGCRAGKHSRLRPGRVTATEIATTRELPGTVTRGMLILVMVGRCPSSVSPVNSDDARVRTTTSVRVLRHTTPVAQRLVFGALSVQSANNKIDEIMDVRRECALDNMLLSETWYDGDSVSIRRLRNEGLQVLERARPRTRSASLRVNHGGVAIAVVPGVRMSAVTLNDDECRVARKKYRWLERRRSRSPAYKKNSSLVENVLCSGGHPLTSTGHRLTVCGDLLTS